MVLRLRTAFPQVGSGSHWARRSKDESDDGCSPELPRRDQGHRDRRGRCERGEPDDRGRPPGRRVHRRQHRRADPVDVRRGGEARHRSRDDARSRGGLRPGGRALRRARARRRDRGDPQGRRHGLHHRRRGWRHRDGRRARRRRDREGSGCADDRRRHPAVRVRGSQARDPGGPRHHRTEEGRRHVDRGAERSAPPGLRSEHPDGRGVPHGGPGPVPGRRRHHVADHHAGSHQPRLRRREVGHDGRRVRP